MNKKRDNFIEFGYHTFHTLKDNIYPLLGFVIAMIGAKNHYALFVKYGFYILMALMVIYSLLKWYNKTFEFDTNMIKISEGVFKRRQNDIPLSRIKSITTSDSLIKRMLGISNLSVELIGGSKTIFVLKNREITHLKKYLFQEVDENKEKLLIKKFAFIEYFLLSLTNLSAFLGALSFVLSIFSIVLARIASMFGIEDDSSEDNTSIVERVDSIKDINLFDPSFFGPILAIIIAGALVSFIFSLVLNYLNYGNFEITSSTSDIKIRYGILNKRSYHIPKNHIRSVRINEPLVFRFFGYVQLKVDNIGLSERQSASVMIYPVIKKNAVDDILATHLSTFKQQSINLQPVRGTLFSFLIPHIGKLFFCTAVLMIFNTKFIYLLALLPFSFLFGFVNWKYTGLSFNQTFTTIRMAKRTYVTTLTTQKKYVETTETLQHFLMNKRNSYHYRLSLYTEESEETYKCNHLSSSSKEAFLHYLK